MTKKYASEEPVLLHQLQQSYMQLATQHNFSASDLASLCDLGKFYGKLLDADCAIVCANPSNMLQIMVRYYDFSSVDFSGLTQLLAKQAGQNVECGFAYVIRSSAEFKEECEELGLRNDVEVHFVLSHYCDQVPGVEIGEYPLVKLGESSSEFQLRQLINEIGPINVTALEKEYSQRYGITGELFFDRYLPCVNDLKRGNQYYPSEDQRVLSGEQRAFLREELDGSGVCCSADLLKTRYEVRFPKSSVDVLSEEILASFARKLSDGLVFEYNTNVRRYFADLISGKVRFLSTMPSSVKRYSATTCSALSLKGRSASLKLLRSRTTNMCLRPPSQNSNNRFRKETCRTIWIPRLPLCSPACPIPCTA